MTPFWNDDTEPDDLRKTRAVSGFWYSKLFLKNYAVLLLEYSAHYTLIVFYKVRPGTLRSPVNTHSFCPPGNYGLEGATD